MEHKHQLAVTGVIVVASGLVAALTIPALATPAAEDARPVAASGRAAQDTEMISALQRDMHLTADQARARLETDDRAGRIEQAMRWNLGSRAFGGAWVANGGSRVVVATTDASKTAKIQASGAEAKLVRRSETDLTVAQRMLDQHSGSAPKTVPGWYVDVAANRLVVLTRAGAERAAKRFVAASGVDADAAQIVRSQEKPRPLIDVIGGNAYYIGGSTRCSIGFSVNGGFVTAGHCGNAGARTTQPSGTFRGSSFPGNDYAWVQVDAGNTPRPLVNHYPGEVTVAGSQEAPVGAAVCRSGSTTGWHCGTINARNASVTYPQGTVNGLIRTNVCAQPGDSGGSLLSTSNNHAQGVTSGGSGNCQSGGTTFFQPVPEILQVYGLTLLTGGGIPPTDPPGNCGQLPSWNASNAYAPGDRVGHNSHGWEATWWSTGAEPGAPGSWAAWKDLGAC